jgi:alkylation response protein AidB-like acyl-CoA dehydrogenase
MIGERKDSDRAVNLAGASPAQRAALLARDFAKRAADHDRDASFSFENFTALKELGLLALTVPRQYVLCSRIHIPQNDSILIAAGQAAFRSVGERKSA